MAANSDAGNERERLERHYADMPDLQLEELAAVAETLTEPARAALRNEISMRKLDIALHQAEPPVDHSLDPLVVLRVFRDLPAAEIAKAALDSAGIESFLFDDNAIRMDWFLSNALGGVKLLVRQDEASAALEILNSAPLDKFKTDEREEFVQPVCPECGSLDVSFRGLKKLPSLASAFLSFPVPFSYANWHCNSCGAQLEEAPGAPAAENSLENNPPKS